MTENQLREYIRMNYPKENEANEWKEFKNLKNDFNGKEKNDIISYVSGIANMDGGNLVIGVVDQTLEPFLYSGCKVNKKGGPGQRGQNRDTRNKIWAK